jgi:hypothetical protein
LFKYIYIYTYIYIYIYIHLSTLLIYWLIWQCLLSSPVFARVHVSVICNVAMQSWSRATKTSLPSPHRHHHHRHRHRRQRMMKMETSRRSWSRMWTQLSGS